MKKNIVVHEGVIQLGSGACYEDPLRYLIDFEPIDTIIDNFENKRVRITIEEIDESN